MKNYFNFPRKRQINFGPTRPTWGAAHARRQLVAGSPRACWHSCKNALALSNNSVNPTRTISIDSDFATEPSDLSPLFNGKVLGHPRTLQRDERWHWRLRRPHETPTDLSTRLTLS